MNYLFHSYFMYTYLRDLEENVFKRKSDLVYLLIFAAALMEVRQNPASALVVNSVALDSGSPCAAVHVRVPQMFALLADPTIHFLSPAMMFLVVTVWARKSGVESVTWFGVVTFGSKWLPWAMLTVSLMLNNNPGERLAPRIAQTSLAASWLVY